MKRTIDCRWSLASAAIGALLVGCAVSNSVEHLGGCLAPAIEQVRSGATRVEQECDVGKRTTIVAVPSTVSADQLVRAGVPIGAAKLMSRTDLKGDRWCEFVDETTPTDSNIDRNRIVCVESSVTLPETVVVTSAKFRMALIRNNIEGGRAAKLLKLSGIS